MAQLVERGLRTLCFAKSRKSAELIHRFTLDRLSARSTATAFRLPRRLYTGAAPQHRAAARSRRAARRLGDRRARARDRHRPARLRDLDGFPGTVASLRQPWGRAGAAATGSRCWSPARPPRPVHSSASPRRCSGERVEAAILDHANPRVPTGTSSPLRSRRRSTTPTARCSATRRSSGQRCCPRLKSTPAGFVWAGRDYPAARVPLRSTSPDSFTVVDTTTGSVLGLVERERAYSTVHEGAVYLHLGEAYRVAELELDARQALVSPFSGDLYTQAKKDTMTAIDDARRTERRLGLELNWGAVSVTEQVVAYQVKQASTQATLDLVRARSPRDLVRDRGDLVLPPSRRCSRGRARAEAARLAARSGARDDRAPPLWAMCDRWDIGGLSTNVHFPDRPADDLRLRRPRRRRGDHRARVRGVRRLGRGHREDDRGLPRASTACPSCVQSPKCGNLNDMLDKGGALELLRRDARLLGRRRRGEQPGTAPSRAPWRTVAPKRDRP